MKTSSKERFNSEIENYLLLGGDGYLALSLAMFRQAVVDVKQTRRPVERISALLWLTGEQAEMVAEVFGGSYRRLFLDFLNQTRG